MIHLLGASHMGVVVSSWVHPEETQHRGFGQAPPSFLSLRSRFPEDREGVRAASLYIGHYSPWWGANLAQSTDGRTLAIAPGFRELLESMPTSPDDVLFVFMTGEEHFHLGWMDHEPAIDFELPWRPELPISAGRQVLPYKVIESQMAAYLTKAFLNFTAIRRMLPGLRIHSVICPPPIPSMQVEDHQSGREWVRLKYYLAYVELLTRFTQALGIGSIAPPAHALDEHGFLKAELAGDKVHGSLAYGEAVIAQIRAAAAGRGS